MKWLVYALVCALAPTTVGALATIASSQDMRSTEIGLRLIPSIELRQDNIATIPAIRVSVRNVSAELLSLQGDPVNILFDLEIRDSKGRLLKPDGYPVEGWSFLRGDLVTPHSTAVIKTGVNGDFTSIAQWGYSRLPPGQYSINVLLRSTAMVLSPDQKRVLNHLSVHSRTSSHPELFVISNTKV